MAETNFSAGAKPIDGAVPNLTWQQFLSYMTGTASAADTSGGEGGSAGFGGQTAATSYGYVPGIGGVGQDIGGNQYVQDLGNGTRNWFSEDPTTGGVVSKNQTADNDSWWDKAGLPLVASLAFGGAAAGLGAAGVGVSGVGSGIGAGTAYGAGAAGAAEAAPSILGGTALDALGLSPSDAAVDLSGQVAPGLEGSGFQNLSGALDGGTDLPAAVAPTTTTAPTSFLDTLQNGWDGISNAYKDINPLTRLGIGAATSEGLSALSGGGGGDASTTNPYTSVVQSYAPAAGESSSVGGGPSGTGMSYSDAANSVANNTPYSGSANDGAPVTSSSGNGGSTTNGGLVGTLGNLINGNTLGSSDYSNLLGGAGSILSGILGYTNANKGLAAQTTAANNNTALAQNIYNTNTALNAPFTAAGYGALGKQSDLLGLNGTTAQTNAYNGFQASPNYQFALSQGLKGVENSASAAGGLFSGKAAKDLNNYAQGQASQQYNTYYGDLGGITQLGQASANQQAANGNSLLSNVSGNNNALANATTAAGNASTNAVTGSLSSLLGQDSSSGLNSILLNALLKNAGGTSSNGYYLQPKT